MSPCERAVKMRGCQPKVATTPTQAHLRRADLQGGPGYSHFSDKLLLCSGDDHCFLAQLPVASVQSRQILFSHLCILSPNFLHLIIESSINKGIDK